MKKLSFATAASVAVLMAAAPAIAGTQYPQTGNQIQPAPESAAPPAAMQEAPAATRSAPAGARDTISDSASAERIETIEAPLLGAAPGAAAAPLSIDKRMTAEGMLGKPIYNQKNERVATVEDLILDASGQANLVVVKDNTFLGLGGKLAAFDYASVTDRKEDGDLVMPLTDRAIEQVAEFSYQPVEGNTAIRAVPDRGYSLKKVLAGDIIGPDGKKLAAIENVTLQNGRANLVIGAYNQIFNMGGDRVALNFDTAQLVQEEGKDNINLKLTAAQVQQFENLKEKKD